MFDVGKWSRAMRNEQEGFTLVELMVVVVIIGILVAIAIPTFGGIQETARNDACNANIRTIEGAMAMYQADEGEEATSMDDLTNADESEHGPYLEETPQCPWDDSNYSITDGDVDPCDDEDCENSS